MTKIEPADLKNIYIASEMIKNGKVVAFPTETVYGLGANALDPKAVAMIFEAKKRPKFDPLIVHISNYQMLYNIAKNIPEEIEKLIQIFWPGPLTVVLEKREIVPSLTTAGLSTVAVRMPQHPVALRLISLSDTPIAAPSANPFGKLSPTKADQVYKGLEGKVELILDGGPAPIGIESTIIKKENGDIYLLRPGGISVEDIEKILEKKVKEREVPKIEAPGSFPSHYSPIAPLYVLKGKKIPSEFLNKKIGFLAFSSKPDYGKFKIVRILSESSDLKEAAKNFFTYLHEIDNAGIDYIFAEKVPLKGLGLAIMDRLKKASKNKFI